LKAEVKKYTTNKDVHGGAHGRRFSGERAANTEHGVVKRIGCSHRDCRWELQYEQRSAGWYLVGCTFPEFYEAKQVVGASLSRQEPAVCGHNHELQQDDASIRAHRTGLYVPSELSQLARDAGKKASAPLLHSILKEKATEMHLPVTWDQSLLYDTFVRDRSDGSFDMDAVVETLLQRQKTEVLGSFVRTTSTPQGELMLDRVFVELEDGMAEWARGGDANVI
jgi:hypothetical protein